MTPQEPEVPTVNPHAPHANSAVVLEKSIFCAGCQAKTTHKMSVDKNNEIVATCDCSRTLKFPLFDSPTQFDEHLDAHHAANVGQITVEQAKSERDAYDERFKKLMGVA